MSKSCKTSKIVKFRETTTHLNVTELLDNSCSSKEALNILTGSINYRTFGEIYNTMEITPREYNNLLQQIACAEQSVDNKIIGKLTYGTTDYFRNTFDTISPSFYLTDFEKTGLFVLDSSDTTSSDNLATILVKDTKRYKRALVEDYVQAEWFQSSSDAGNDTLMLQRAINYCDTNQKELRLRAKTYTIKSQLLIRNVTITGVPRKTKLLIHSGYTFPNSGIAARDYTIIMNEQFRGDFTSLFNRFYLRYIDFEMGLITNSHNSPSLLGFANTRGCVIEECNVRVTSAQTKYTTAIDLWACNKNFTIRKCLVENLSDVAAGGSIWIRNISTAGNLSANDTEDILVEDCVLRHATKDEPLAVYGVRGHTHDVTIRNSKVEGIATTQARSVLISCFPLDDGSAEGENAKVSNVLFDNLHIVDNYYKDNVIRIGQSGDDSNKLCDNITVNNCNFNISKSVNETNYVIRNIKCVGNNNKATNNYMIVSSGSNITYGIAGFDLIANNYIKGIFTVAIQGGTASYNKIDGVTGRGFENCDQILYNNCKSGSHCVVIQPAPINPARIEGNYFENTATTATNTVGIYVQSIGGLNPSSLIVGNIIRMNYIGNFAIRKEGTGGMSLLNNTIVGTGSTILCAAGSSTVGVVAQMIGNLWYSNRDDIRAAGYIDADHNAACRVGFRVFLTDGRTVSVKRYTNGNSSDWVNYDLDSLLVI